MPGLALTEEDYDLMRADLAAWPEPPEWQIDADYGLMDAWWDGYAAGSRGQPYHPPAVEEVGLMRAGMYADGFAAGRRDSECRAGVTVGPTDDDSEIPF